MGPMGNYMTLLQLARGRGGYGGPQGYGGYGMPRGPMGYGGPPQGAFGPSGGNMTGAAGQMPGWLQGLSASPGMQALRDKYAGMGPQGSSWEQAPPQGAMAGASYLGGGSPQQALQAAYGAMGTGAPQQGGAAPPGMGAHLSAEAKKQELMAQGMSEEDAHRGAMQSYESQMGPAPGAAPQAQSGPGWLGAIGGAGMAGQGYGASTYPGMNTAYNPMGLRGRRRFY